MAKPYRKDLAALEEILHYEQSACVKCEAYAERLTDPETQELLGGLARRHKARFLNLYDYLNKL